MSEWTGPDIRLHQFLLIFIHFVRRQISVKIGDNFRTPYLLNGWLLKYATSRKSLHSFQSICAYKMSQIDNLVCIWWPKTFTQWFRSRWSVLDGEFNSVKFQNLSNSAGYLELKIVFTINCVKFWNSFPVNFVIFETIGHVLSLIL